MSNDSKDELTLRIGEKLAAARIACGLTQARAAKAVGTSQSCISAIEHGKKQNVNMVIALIKLYGASYDEVFGEMGKSSQSKAVSRSDEGSQLLSELIKDSGIKGLETQTDMAVKICIYMLLRKLYAENPHNSQKLFELDTAQTMERCVKFLSAQPYGLDRLLGSAGKKVNRLEVSVGKNPELRAFIKECEHILLACT